MSNSKIEWKLGALLDELGVTALQVEREAIRLGLGLGKNTVYRLLRDDGPQRLDRETLASIITAIRSLTGRPITLGDLLEYVAGEAKG